MMEKKNKDDDDDDYEEEEKEGEEIVVVVIIIIIIIINVLSCHRSFLSGTSLESAVIPTAQASSFTLQYFPYCV
jgi:heme/copper-type cytochrome/quinol oxidase subunit 2